MTEKEMNSEMQSNKKTQAHNRENLHIGDCDIIVFGFEHYNPLGIIRSLGETGIFPIAVVVEGKKRITSKSKYIKKLHMVKSVQDGYELIVSQYGNKKEKTFILASDDTISSLLDQHYDELKSKFIFYNAGAQGRITQYMDKRLLTNVAAKYGLKVPETYKVSEDEILNGIKYPVITKAKDSIEFGWKKYTHLCRNEKELKQAIVEAGGQELIVQQYVNKYNELCLDGLSINHGSEIFVSMASTYTYILPDSYSFMFKLSSYEDKRVLQAIQSMLSEIGYEGIFTVEFLIGQDNELYFIEINFRNSAWAYASTCLGMNLAKIWIEGMLKDKLEKNIKKEIPDNYTAMVELPDFKTRVIGKRMGLLKWIKELKSCSCMYYYNSKDPEPFWSAIKGTILRHGS